MPLFRLPHRHKSYPAIPPSKRPTFRPGRPLIKKPAVDYRGFRLRKINDPQFSHLKLLSGWILYFILYALTENLIPAENCHSVHIQLDDMIPFCEYFLIPYVLWYGLIVISLGYFALYNTDSFTRLQTYFIVTQLTAMAIYILFPSRQDLRPTDFPRDNLFTAGIRFLYAIDTNTGVCPSMHVALSLGMVSVWTKEKGVSLRWKILIVIVAVLICLSTMFIKQHSALDFFAALPLCLLAEVIVYPLPRPRPSPGRTP